MLNPSDVQVNFSLVRGIHTEVHDKKLGVILQDVLGVLTIFRFTKVKVPRHVHYVIIRHDVDVNCLKFAWLRFTRHIDLSLIMIPVSFTFDLRENALPVVFVKSRVLTQKDVVMTSVRSMVYMLALDLAG